MNMPDQQAIVFGKYEHLLGVWKNADAESMSGVAVVMVTPGMLHHSGPFRLHVDLANELSTIGIPSLRFDLSGIGESLGVGVTGRSIDRAANEIAQAIDWILKHTKSRQVVLFGLCSGADDSVHAALSDERVVGVIAMDGCGYRTPGFHVHRFIGHTLPRILRPSKWMKLVKRIGVDDNEISSSLQPGTDVREFPSRDQSVQELKQLARRKVQMHFVYTGGVGEYFNYAGQFTEMFPELAGEPYVSSHYFAAMDHVAILAEDRAVLVNHIVNRVQSIAVATPTKTMDSTEVPTGA
ncbi:serine aminopeptidase domain-containing protein [Rubripirellula reticaptiva]|uniref:Alpha/beta hydrolase family protein n=1 Tax=Rubripirellula reticaptiva TaxID=2528013 RepID=A0A5C6EEX8_9BACT|nr:alpha/beta hydrolase [Rubripirellula reticaptiva]TWU48323.1 Alpha/beta hydrolase family protein [Rubripirellula reticaptiva]